LRGGEGGREIRERKEFVFLGVEKQKEVERHDVMREPTGVSSCPCLVDAAREETTRRRTKGHDSRKRRNETKKEQKKTRHVEEDPPARCKRHNVTGTALTPDFGRNKRTKETDQDLF
jgi:hypothetical protein